MAESPFTSLPICSRFPSGVIKDQSTLSWCQGIALERKGMDVIHDITRRDDVESLRRILTADPGFPLADPKFTCFRRTPLHVAANFGYVEFASQILSMDPQLAMEVDAQGCTPLHLASKRKNVEMVRVLINANPSACVVADQNGGTPLHLAAMRNEVEIMDLLIRSRPEAIHQVLPNTNETILHLCVKHNNYSALQKLVKYLVTNRVILASYPNAISVNSLDSDGNTILHLAAKWKRTKILKYLIGSDDIGVDINIRNNEDVRALYMVDQNEMDYLEFGCGSCGKYHADTEEVHTTSRNDEWLKERRNTIISVAALIAGIAFQAVINPPGGCFPGRLKD
ncbi:hypothetical protein MKW92_008557 [Papaver armeniacum]|nr:hypothetical protein MKW92_008557 [Papaver armeniacum]